MDTFISGDVLWPQGWTKLHVYFLPDLAEIQDLVDVYREVLDEFTFVAPVPDEWLHATVQMIDGVAARDVTEEQLAELEATLRQQLGGLAPFTMTVGGAVAGRAGVVLDLTPDAEFNEMIRRTRTTIRDVLGLEVTHSIGRPHITLGYARGHGDSGMVGSQLRRATDQRGTLTVTEVSLVDVIQDPERHQYRWKRLARFPLEDAGTPISEIGRRAGLYVVPADAESMR